MHRVCASVATAVLTMALPVFVIVLMTALLTGCRSSPETARAPISALPPPAQINATAPAPASAAASPIRLASAEVQPEAGKEMPKKDEPKEKIDLPRAIQLCTLQNFRLQASATRIAQAEGELITASLIPNSRLFTDLQLIPLQHTDPQNQLGPTQQDAIFEIPIDWLVFGKRVAAMQAQKLGVSVARADQDDEIRKAVSVTVDTFYAVLQGEEMLKLAEEEHDQAKKIQAVIAKQPAATDTEKDRIRLEVLETLLNVHGRELELATFKARLRPLIGRTATDPDFEVVGTLALKAVVPVPDLKTAIALAEQHRPDLISDRFSIDQASATVHLEERRARPQAVITPGWSYQYQHPITGYPNGSMLDMGIAFTLPITDRNQGNIHKAQWQLAQAQFTHQADIADVRAEVEIIIATYDDAVEDVTQNDDPATLTAALELRRKADAEFAAGRLKLVEVLDAHRASAEREARHIEFLATYWRVLNRLNTVVGLNAFDHTTGATMPVEYGKEKAPDKK
jgi:outer membrane protein, heavy metal efflux system